MTNVTKGSSSIQKDLTVGENLKLTLHPKDRDDGSSDYGLYTDDEGNVKHGRIRKFDPLNIFPNGLRREESIWPFQDPFALSTDPSPYAESTLEIQGVGNFTSIDELVEGMRFPITALSSNLEFVNTVEAKLKSQVDEQGNPVTDDVRIFTGFSFYDAQGLFISWFNSQYVTTSITTLAVDLNRGDTTATLTSAAGWEMVNTSYVVGANYVDSNGHNWGESGYSRNVSAGVDNQIDTIEGNVITFKGPYTGPAMVAGQVVRQASSAGGSFRYVGWTGNIVGNAWENREGILHRGTNFDDPIMEGTSILSGAVEAAPVVLVRPTNLTSTWTVGLGAWSLQSIRSESNLGSLADVTTTGVLNGTNYTLLYDGVEDNYSLVPERRPRYPQMGGGRAYLYEDLRWISWGDDNYSVATENMTESAGTGVDPIQEWEHGGHMVKAGETLKQLTLRMRGTGIDKVDVECILSYRTSLVPGAWFPGGSGVDNDNEMVNTTLLREFWMNPVDEEVWGIAHGGLLNDTHFRVVDFDFTFPEDGFLTIYTKPTVAGVGTDFMQVSYRYEFEGIMV